MSMPSDPTVYEGKLSDGRTAATMRVNVRFAEAGLEILPAGERRAPLVWPYANLGSSVPLRTDAPDALLSLKPAGTQTLFVADPAFSRSLRARVGDLSPARQRLAGLRPGAVFATLVAAIVGAIWYMDYRPLQAAARLMPQDAREKMGRNVVASLAAGMRTCETGPGRAALDRLTQRLVTAASDRPMPVRVVMVNWGEVNAFAAPGGQLVLTRGLVQTAGSAEEVAGVLAHELGHAIELHPETGLIRTIALGAAADLIFAGAGSATNIGLALTELRYSRAAEREADTHALRILKNAGIAARGFGDFFERIGAMYGGKRRDEKTSGEKEKADSMGRRLLTIVSTHPLTDERIAMVRAQPAYPATPALSEVDWRALREMCGAPTAPRQPASTPAQRQPGPPPAERQPGAPSGGSQDERKGTNL